MAFARLSAAGVDTIVVRRQELTGASRPVVVVSGSVIRDSIGLETDVLPSIVAFGDLNDDGWRDIVLLAEDESSALPVVVLVTAHGLAVPHPKPLDLWKTMQVTWADEGPADTCESGLQPRIITGPPGEAVLSVAVGAGDRNGGCPILQRKDLVVTGDTIAIGP